jgi:hypothetical protein
METGKEMPGKWGAILIGLLEIGIGLLCCLMGVLVLSMSRINPMMADNPGTLSAGVFYLFVGAVFIVFAVGTMAGMRWARVLMLIFSWFWLVCGVVGLANLMVLWPSMRQSFERAGAASPQAAVFVEILIAVFFTAFFIVLPGIFILFYGRKKAKENFEAWDPRESWTDKCPAPVLAISLCAAIGGVIVLPLLCIYHFVFPFFGTLLEGLPGALCCLLTAGLLVYAAWGTFRLRMAAWWTLVGFYLVSCVSTVWTFYNHSILEMDEKMGFTAAQLGTMKDMPLFNNNAYWSAYIGAIFLLYLGYMLFIRKYFVKNRS